jgi:bifunctional DNA-binding transcriptional regulator/antitoxin component of YhaV-PrlF toxin-antitoxin module
MASLVRMKDKFQLTLPAPLRRKSRFAVGDLFSAEVSENKITFTAKSVVDRHIAEGLDDIEKGRVHGPFDTAEEMIASLRKGGVRKRSR